MSQKGWRYYGHNTEWFWLLTRASLARGPHNKRVTSLKILCSISVAYYIRIVHRPVSIFLHVGVLQRFLKRNRCGVLFDDSSDLLRSELVLFCLLKTERPPNNPLVGYWDTFTIPTERVQNTNTNLLARKEFWGEWTWTVFCSHYKSPLMPKAVPPPINNPDEALNSCPWARCPNFSASKMGDFTVRLNLNIYPTTLPLLILVDSICWALFTLELSKYIIPIMVRINWKVPVR